MKQHITKQQYDELSDGEKNLLSYWVVDHPNGCCAPHIIEIYDGDALLTIGQMIEFLDEHRYGNLWTIFVQNSQTYRDDGYLMDIKANDICDALWYAVKDVLEKEDK